MRWEDQEKIRANISGGAPAPVAAKEEVEEKKPAKRGRKRKADEELEPEPAKKAPAKRRRKGDPEPAPAAPAPAPVPLDPEEQKRREALAVENKDLWAIKDSLEGVSTDELREMCELNGRSRQGGRPTLLERAAQGLQSPFKRRFSIHFFLLGMLFGAIPACPECQGPTLRCVDGEVYRV